MKRKPAKIKRKPVKIKRRPVTFSSKKKVVRTPVSTLILSKKDPMDDPEDFKKEMNKANKRVLKQKKFLKLISKEVGYIENLTETNLERTRLYKYQKKWINDRSKYRHGDKSRQIGQSYAFACEAYAKAQLMKIYTAIFTSYNQSEANEKILYARLLHESTPYKYRKKLVIDRITALEFEGKLSDGRKTRTRLISHPQREPRGKGFNTDVFLDEIAHYQWPEKVYVAAVPIVTRGLGQLSLASSPLGRSGLHYEIGHDTDTYNMFSRHKVYWWNNPDFLNEDALRMMEYVEKEAPRLTTEERVLEFGNNAIIQAYRSMIEEDFKQEYEIDPVDESVAYFPIQLINQCTFEALQGEPIFEKDDVFNQFPIYKNSAQPGLVFKTYKTPEELSHAILKGDVSKVLYAGMDIGRNENNSEVFVIEECKDRNSFQIVRYYFTMKKTEFRTQFNKIDRLFKILPIRLMKIDSTGIGSNIGEDLKRKYGSRIDDLKINNENKGQMAVNFKLRLEDQSIAIPSDRDLIRQIHSVRRKVSENSVVKFEVKKNRLHHGDKFWALALASSAGEPAQMYHVKLTSVIPKQVTGTKRLFMANTKKMFASVPVVIGGISHKKFLTPPSDYHPSLFQFE